VATCEQEKENSCGFPFSGKCENNKVSFYVLQYLELNTIQSQRPEIISILFYLLPPSYKVSIPFVSFVRVIKVFYCDCQRLFMLLAACLLAGCGKTKVMKEILKSLKLN